MAEVSQEPSQVVLPAWEPWIPSIDDIWDALQRVKGNFANNGFARGGWQTMVDTFNFISTWRIWKTETILRTLVFVISFGNYFLRLYRLVHYVILICSSALLTKS